MIKGPWRVPTGWTWATFEEVARVASDLVDPHDYLDSPHIAPNHIESGSGLLLPYKSVREDGVTSAKHRFRSGQILYSKIRPYLAKVVRVDFDGLCSADMYPIESDLDHRFLKWWMLTREFTRRAAGEQARTVLPKINKRSLATLPVPVPPMEEQLKIVEMLEDHLSRLDAADRYLGTARARLGTVPWSLLRSHPSLREVESVPLGEILAAPLTNGRSVPTRIGGFPVLRLTALKSGAIDLRERKAGDWSAADAKPFLVEQGDFLVSRGNGSLSLVARGGLVTEAPDPVAYPDTLIRVRTDASKVDCDYLALLWNSPLVRRQVESMARTTAGIYKVNQGHLRSVTLPMPALPVQRQLAREVMMQVESSARLEADIDLAHARSVALRRALLETAFSGQLMGLARDDEVIRELAEA